MQTSIKLFLLVILGFCSVNEVTYGQACINGFDHTHGVGNAPAGWVLQDYLNVRHFITGCEPSTINGLVREPALRLDYDDELYFGQLSMVRNTFRNSLLANSANEGDLILRNSCHGDDIVITTQSTTGEIRFATTPSPGLGAECPSQLPPNNEPAQSGSLNDKERMTILPNGNVGVGTMNAVFSATLSPAASLPISSPFQVGNISVQPVNFSIGPSGTWGSIAYNSFWDPTVGKPKRLENGPVCGIGFEPWHASPPPAPNAGSSHGISSDGGISLFVSENGTANSVYDNGCGMMLRPDALFVNMWQPGQAPAPDIYRVLFEYRFPHWNSGKTEILDDGRLFIRDKVHIGREELATGTTTPFGGIYKLVVDGSVLAREIVVDARAVTWSDFVFDPSYELTPILELDKIIAEEKHLPGIPTSSEVYDNGIQLGEFQAKLLQKIEELTLYVIQLKKENESLNSRLETIENTKQ